MRRGSVKKMLLKISQKSQKNICAGVFFNEDSSRGSVTLLQRDSSIGSFFFANSAKFLKTHSKNFGNVCERLLLRVISFDSLLS